MSKALLEIIGKWTTYAKDSIYTGKISEITTNHEKDFVLETDDAAYVYVHDLPLLGPKDVVAAYESKDEGHELDHLSRKIKSIEWIDNHEQLLFHQEGSHASFRAVGYPYGCFYIVRIAKITFE